MPLVITSLGGGHTSALKNQAHTHQAHICFKKNQAHICFKKVYFQGCFPVNISVITDGCTFYTYIRDPIKLTLSECYIWEFYNPKNTHIAFDQYTTSPSKYAPGEYLNKELSIS